MTEASPSRRFWRYVRGLWPPVLLWLLFVAALVNAFQSRFQGDEEYDRAALREWVEESRVFRATLPDLVRSYLTAADTEADPEALAPLREEIQVQLQSLGDPTKMYGGQLPLFPAVYRLELDFPGRAGPLFAPVVWESGIPRPRQNQQTRVLEHTLVWPGDAPARIRVEYQLHAYNKRQRDERAAAIRLRWICALAAVATALAFWWIYLVQRRERERERRRLLDQRQIDRAERAALENELRMRAAERKQEEAERQALELKSQLYASIGIMAGSYAHNIKNLLVRPNDLLRRCLEGDGLSREQDHMLREVRQTLGTVTERLQEILHTVRRDPSRSETTRFDLNAVVRDIRDHWEELAREKWKLLLSAELSPDPLVIEGDPSHVQQAVENLLFNARDATFEMRNLLREEARRGGREGQGQRQALITAAAWKGEVVLRTWRDDGRAVLEVRDNGVGMTEEVRRHCTETHFSTKRNNAIYEGHSTGMGLGLSFVAAILEHHRAGLEIESAPGRGAMFRVRFPLAG